MAKAIYGVLLRPETMSGDKGYRIELSYGTFSIQPRNTPSGRYWYAYKRVKGRLYKRYVAKQGEVTQQRLNWACLGLAQESGLLS